MHALEQQVRPVVILHFDSFTNFSGTTAGPIWKGPAQQHSVTLQSEVVMEARCKMLFHGIGALAKNATVGFCFHLAASSPFLPASSVRYSSIPARSQQGQTARLRIVRRPDFWKDCPGTGKGWLGFVFSHPCRDGAASRMGHPRICGWFKGGPSATRQPSGAKPPFRSWRRTAAVPVISSCRFLAFPICVQIVNQLPNVVNVDAALLE